MIGNNFCKSFGIRRSTNDVELELPRKLFAMYCHAAEVVAMDTPYLHFANLDGLQLELDALKQFGFKGKFAAHPSQIDLINKAFIPEPEDADYARKLATAFERAVAEGKTSIIFENQVIDLADYNKALDVLDRAGIRVKIRKILP